MHAHRWTLASILADIAHYVRSGSSHYLTRNGRRANVTTALGVEW